MQALAELELSERIRALIALSERFGPIFPTFGVVAVEGGWACECGKRVCRVGKHPRIKSWNTRATKDPKQIAAWATKWPGANWAIKTGVDMDAVDLDRKPGKPDGVLTLASWEDTMGVTTPDSVRVSTGTGVQVYFQPGSGLRTTNNPDGTGIDVRATGGYCMCPGSRHVNGNVYQIVLDEGLEACPAWLIEQISGKSAIQQNQQDSPKSNTSYNHRVGVEANQQFQARPNAELSPEKWVRINQLQLIGEHKKFWYTWEMTRATSSWPFKSGRNSPSEYEASISCFLVWDGWDDQSIMDAICVWRRKHGLVENTYYSRYARTLRTARAIVTPRRSKGVGGTRKESKGLYRQNHTRNQILGTIISTPKTPKEIAAATGIDPVHVRVVLRRLAKDDKVIRDNHTYLCAPGAEPWTIPSEEELQRLDAVAENADLAEEYAAAVAAGMFDGDISAAAEEEDVTPPILVPPTAAVTVEPAPIEYPAYDERDFGTYASRRAAMAAWELKWKLETRDRLREHRKRPNYNSMASLKRASKLKRLAAAGMRGAAEFAQRLRDIKASESLEDDDSPWGF